MAAPRLTEKERAYRALAAEQAESGLSVAEFAHSRDIPVGTFGWWKSEIRRRDALRAEGESEARADEEVVPFVPVRIVSEEVVAVPRPASRFEVVLPWGTKVRIPGGADEASVARVLRAVVASC